jgi:hypothetical protein
MKEKKIFFMLPVGVAVLFIFLCLPANMSAREIGGVQLPDSVSVAGNKLILNGAGIRTKFIFDVYAGGLYLRSPYHDEEAIIAADTPMLVRMHFIHDGISPEKMQHGWLKGFRRLAPDADKKLQQAMAKFNDLFTVTVRENDIYDIGWIPGKGLEVRFNGRVLDVIDSFDLKKVLFTIWFGKDPADSDLKEGMLGR